MLDIVNSPVVSRKSIRLLESHGKYVFDVDNQLTKFEIRLWLEKMFSVKIRILNIYYRRHTNLCQDGSHLITKRAIVTFADPIFLYSKII